MPERLQHVPSTQEASSGRQEAAGRAGAAARLSARRRGRTCPGTAAAPIDHPRAEGAAGALDPRRAQLPTLDLSQIRSRPRRSACTVSSGHRRHAARAGTAARLSARQRGRTCQGSTAAAPRDHPRAEGAAAALDPRRAQLPAPDLSQNRSRPKPCRSACSVFRTPRRPTAATGGRRAGRSCCPFLCPATWPDVSGNSGGPDRSSQGRRCCRCPRSAPGAAARAGSLPDQEQARPAPERLLKVASAGEFEHYQCFAALE